MDEGSDLGRAVLRRRWEYKQLATEFQLLRRAFELGRERQMSLEEHRALRLQLHDFGERLHRWRLQQPRALERPRPELAPRQPVQLVVSRPARPARRGGQRSLTAREREVAALLMRGYTNRQIAEALTITPGTAANHVTGILAKLDCANRTQALVELVGRARPAARAVGTGGS